MDDKVKVPTKARRLPKKSILLLKNAFLFLKIEYKRIIIAPIDAPLLEKTIKGSNVPDSTNVKM